MTAEEIQSVVDLFNFEDVLPEIIAPIFTANGMTTATRLTISKFQEQRPRVNLLVKTGSVQSQGTSGHQTILTNGSTRISDAYKLTLAASIITNSEEADKVIHAHYTALIRWIMAQIGPLINGSLLTLHKIQFANESGTSLICKSDDGYWVSSIEFAIDLSLQTNALKALTIPTTEAQE